MAQPPAFRPVQIGVAYRPQLRVDLFNAPRSVDYLEITAEHYLDARGRLRDDLDALRASFPIVVHALDVSIGSAAGIDPAYLERLAALVEYVRAPWWSDHLGFTHAGGRSIGQFVPLRRDARSIEIVARNADAVRRVIATPFALENPALPFVIPGGTMDEGTFLTRAARAARCGLVLDIENMHANERNLAEPAGAAIDAIPPELIVEFHLAGGREIDGAYVDSHDAAVPERTWQLTRRLLDRADIPAITLERDARLDDLGTLAVDLRGIRQLIDRRAA